MCSQMRHGPRFSEREAREAVAKSRSYSEALRHLKLRPAGGNHLTLKKYVALWKIPTNHFDPYATQRIGLKRDPIPLEQVLVANSNYSRGSLKERLYKEGLKTRECELCGQGETWRGQHIALILDHV